MMTPIAASLIAPMASSMIQSVASSFIKAITEKKTKTRRYIASITRIAFNDESSEKRSHKYNKMM